MRATARKFPGHKRLPAPGRFVIEQNAAARMHVVGLRKFTVIQCRNRRIRTDCAGETASDSVWGVSRTLPNISLEDA